MKNNLFLIILLLTFMGINGCYFQSNEADNNTINTKFVSSESPEHNHDFSGEDSHEYYSTTLTVKGDVRFPLTLTVDSLKKMRTIGLDSFNIVCQSGAVTDKTVKSRGVLLKDILEKASIAQTSHKDRNFYIVAKGNDGYMATFSWAELFNNPTGENTYVTYEEDGLPIKEKGAMILNCTNDIKTGPRHVVWLSSIEVNRVK
ncbi:MAG: molybdopterin-dependent oxidoreductase [Chitinophagaceae bacterium]|nr:molybdopterin-dependent oxidoreductase [Chitinophagaceae bacterium]